MMTRQAAKCCAKNAANGDRLHVLGAMILVVLSGFTGCRRQQPQPIISAIPSDSAQTDYVCEHAGLAEAAAPYKVHVYWNGPTGIADSRFQIALVDRAIRNRHLGIVLTPTASNALSTVVERALGAGIPVVLLGQSIQLPADPRLFVVVDDMRQTEQLAVERIRAITHDRGEVAIVGVDAHLPDSLTRIELFKELLAEQAPSIQIATTTSDTNTFGQAEMATTQLLQAHEQLRVLYSMTPASTAGAVAAVHNAGRANDVSVIGHDQSGELLAMLRHGAIDALIIRNMRAMGGQAVNDILAARSHRSAPQQSRFSSTLVTRENIDTEPVQLLLRMDWRPIP